MTIYTPYTYLIGWSKYHKFYYGLRFAKIRKTLYKTGCHPDDLWVTYFTSSKHVKEFISEYGQPDIIQIRRTFSDAKSAQIWEHKVLRRMKVIENHMWINANNGIEFSNKAVSTETKRKLSEARKGKKVSEETKRRLSQSKKGKPVKPVSEDTKRKLSEARKGVVITEETRKKLSKIGKGRLHSDETKRKISTSKVGKKHSEETKRKISASRNNKMYITDGITIKSIDKNSDIPSGFWRGRSLNSKHK